jgi:hypothetical protein
MSTNNSISSYLSAGEYYIQPTGDFAGEFMLFSMGFSEGALARYSLMESKESYTFDSDALGNCYSFTIEEAQDVSIGLSDSSGGMANVKIYDSNFDFVSGYGYSGTHTEYLSAGQYYLHVYDDLGGSVSVVYDDSSSSVVTTPVVDTPTTVSLTQLESFVARLYTEILDRDYDQAGLEYWSSSLQSGEKSANDIAKSFFYSDEFLSKYTQNNEFVITAYNSLLGREPDSSGYLNWINNLNSGMSREKLIDGFISSEEFSNLAADYGIASESLSELESFVARLYTEILGRNYDDSGLEHWSNSLQSGANSANDIAKSFFYSDEFLSKSTSNSEFVTTAYNSLLGRDPDSSGYTNWMNNLNSGMSREKLIDGFIYSDEFSNLASNYGISVDTASVVSEPTPVIEDDTVTISDVSGYYRLDSFHWYERGSGVYENYTVDGKYLNNSYLQIEASGNLTRYISYSDNNMYDYGKISIIDDDEVLIIDRTTNEEFTYEYEYNDSNLTLMFSGYEDGNYFEQTCEWVVA